MNTKENVLSTKNCASVLQKYFQTNASKILNYQENKLFTPACKSGAFYFAIKIKVRQAETSQDVNFVGKTTTRQEIEFHKNVLPEIEKSAEATCCPKSYLTQGDNVIVFEDFFGSGFVFREKPNELDANHVKLAIKALAKLHATSLIYESKKSEVLGENCQLTDVCNNLKSGDKALDNFRFKAEIKQLEDVIKLLGENNLIDGKLNDSLNDVVESSVRLIKLQKFKKVLCHGNLSDQNVLYKYNESNTAIDCKLINFEFAHYNPPVVDLLQFLFMTTTSEMRQHMLDEFLQFYYLCLQTELKIKNLDVHTIIPYKEDYQVSIYHFLPFIKLHTTCLNLPKSLNDLSNQNSCLDNKFWESLAEIKDLMQNKGLLLEDIRRIVKSKLKTTDYKLLDYSFKPLSEMSGFLGDHNKLIINVSHENHDKTLFLFAKFMPHSSAQIEVANDTNAFPKESFMYEELFTQMKNAEIDLIEDCVVPCHFGRYNHVLVFDDFGARNYKSLDARKPFNYPQIQLLIKKLAKLHAASVIFEENSSKQTKTKFCLKDRYSEQFDEYLIHPNCRIIQTGIETVEHCLNLFIEPEFSALNPDLMAKIMKAYDSMFELVKTSDKFRNVLCHGDLWVTNILVQSKDDEFLDCKFVDFQMARYCPPSQDLLTLIYLTTNKELRKAHLDDLINLYYVEMGKNLKAYGYDVSDFFAYDNFLESVDYMIPEAVAQTVLYFQLALINPEIMKSYMSTEDSIKEIMLGDRRDFVTHMFENDALFRDRLKESLDDLIEVCLKYF